MIKRNWIDDIIDGLIEEVGSNNIYDILDYLNINLIKDNDKQNPILKKCDGMYLRNLNGHEIILIKGDLEKEKYTIAHELGHALLHIDYDFLMHNPLALNGKKEREADYFATKLLYQNLEIEDGIETKEQLANYLGVNEEVIEYLIDKTKKGENNE